MVRYSGDRRFRVKTVQENSTTIKYPKLLSDEPQRQETYLRKYAPGEYSDQPTY